MSKLSTEAANHSSLPDHYLAPPRPRPIIYVAWVFIDFAINMAVPLLFSSSVCGTGNSECRSRGFLLLLAVGCFILRGTSKTRHCGTIAGGTLVGLSQLFPALHIIAGSMRSG